MMRNGGPTTYRADLAHRATERRAHQRRHAAAQGSKALRQTNGRDAHAVHDYEETFTTILMQSGVPKMMSRVLVCLYTTDSGSLTRPSSSSASTSARLPSPKRSPTSRASTSSAGNDDEGRRDRYVVDDDLWYQSMLRSARDNAQLADTARQGVAILGPGTPAAARLENIARYLDFVAESITRAAEEAREVLYTKAETTTGGPARPGSDRR